MRLGVVLESDFETRVSVVPNSIPKLVKMGFEVFVEDGAGKKSGYPNTDYEAKGASISNSDEVLGSDLVTSIGVPDFTKMKSGSMLACMADPFRDMEKTKQIIESGITLLSLEVIPRRLSKGQSMDVNSSQDNLSGYCAALKAALREDPDVILVGEMRDLETISLALTAAETGHLVFGTLHTSGAPSTINRIIDVFPPEQQEQIRAQISTSLKMVVTQRLLKTRDGAGRVGAFEIMKCTAPIQNLIREAKIHQIPSIMQTAVRDGMITMEKSLEELVKSGKIDPGAARSGH